MDDFGLTPELITLVKSEEGWRADPYLDQVGLPTIGWGHRIPSLDTPSITPAEGERLMWADLRFHRDTALRLSPGLRDEPQGRCAAITDLCYNVGPVAYSVSHLRTQVNNKEWAKAAANFRTWVWATDPKTKKKFKLAGLIRRRNAGAKWLETGV